jgi:Skp family chaperone for outer membrane proteins
MFSARFLYLGWVIAAAFAGIAVAGGFQAPTDKVGVVDISKIVEKSDYGKANQDTFGQMKATRESLLEFIDTNRVLNTEQAQRLHDLTVKPTLTPEEKAENDRIRADVVAANKKWTELATKTTLTPEERTLLDEYAKRSQSMNDYAQRLYREFTNDMQAWADKQKLTSIEKARAAIQQVAKTGGFNVVFEVGVAPYGANDVTDDALAAMNAAK